MRNIMNSLLRVILFFFKISRGLETTTYEFFAACDICLLSTLPCREMPTFFFQIFFYFLDNLIHLDNLIRVQNSSDPHKIIENIEKSFPMFCSCKLCELAGRRKNDGD